MSPVTISDTTVDQTLRALVLENDTLAVTVLLDQGADIYQFIHKPTGLDVIWKRRMPERRPAIDPPPESESEDVWFKNYRGGWQTIFPNFGRENDYRGLRLPFHGEAALAPWQVVGVEDDGAQTTVTLEVTLRHSPFHLRRVMTLPGREPVLSIHETATNLGPAAMECMWAQHPAFGPPFLSADCVIDTGARSLWTDDDYEVPGNDLSPGQTWAWPTVRDRSGQAVDLSRVPGPGSGHSRVLFLKDFEESWYALTNRALGLGVGVVWNGDLFPYAVFWQETGGVRDFPFYGTAYVTALEPSSSYPNHGLTALIPKTGTQLTLAPGESRTLSLTAVFYEGRRRVARIDPQGSVFFSEEGE